MNDTEKHASNEANDSSIYYILGGVVLVAAVAGFFLLKPKDQPQPVAQPVTQPVAEVPQITPTPAPITKFSCERQYYNPVVGFPKYFLSVEGVDTATTGSVSCDFKMSIKDKVVNTAQATSPLTAIAERNGSTFRCQSKAVELAKGIATVVDVVIKNDRGEEASCSQSFVFP